MDGSVGAWEPAAVRDENGVRESTPQPDRCPAQETPLHAQKAPPEGERPRHRFALAKARTMVLLATAGCMAAGVCLGVLAYWATNSEREIENALLRAVVRQVENSYVEEVPRSRLVDDAIRGMLANLDDHSMLLDERALAVMQEQAAGGFGGVGVVLGVREGRLTVIEPLPDTPAARAGILAGDRLLEVDHRPVRRLSDASRALRGHPDTNVHVRVHRLPVPDSAVPRQHPFTAQPASGMQQDAPSEQTSAAAPRAQPVEDHLDFDITRALIAVSSVRERMLMPGYGYLRIRQFNEHTEGDLAGALASLAAEGPLDGLVVDLRDNPGGLLSASVAVADAFLESGVIVSIVGRARAETQEFSADAEAHAEDVALAVLINQGSASAAEIVASALQHHGRAVVIGTQSYGKGSVQSITHFPVISERARRALKLTTARYFTPAGRSLDNTGVTPDIAVPPLADERAKDYEARLLEEVFAHFRRVRAAG